MSQPAGHRRPSHKPIDTLFRICSGILALALGFGCLALGSHSGSTIIELIGLVMLGIGALALKDGLDGQKNKSGQS